WMTGNEQTAQLAWTDAQGRMHLWVVATGWGGWAASRVLHLRQSSGSHALNALTFEPVGNLPLSWLWNTSFLVRNAPLPLQDGGMVLPVHFELGSKISSMARIGPDGAFRGVTRISQRNHVLQPALIARAPGDWLALMRDERANGKITAAHTSDSGAHWVDLPDLALDNPDASVAAMGLSSGEYLLAHNPSLSGRDKLDLSASANGLDWRLISALRRGALEDEFSYPALAWADGGVWIAYTVDRARLAWQRLEPAVTKDTKP
ncbi:MAG: exo-alpha-sialidase, partial [Rhodoferax sp.]